jgi:hypothetical protein
MAYIILKIISIMVVSVAMAAALGHAFELPGKMRLTKELYYAMQSVYYPGYTIAGGIGEAGGIILVVVLLILSPAGSSAFWLTLVALIALICMQAVYWLFTHPINKIWLKDEKLDSFSNNFFSFLSAGRDNRKLSWQQLRDRWEYSHVIRAGFAFLSLLALVISQV